MKFPRFGCVFCAAHSELRSTHNNHLDSLIKEVTNARAIAPALRKGQHFLPVIRAVRRRSGRNKKQRPIAIKTSEYDCCDKWRLFVMIKNVAELEEFENRVLPSVAEWTAVADSFVAHRAERTQRRLEYDDSDENTDTDTEDGFIPTLPSPIAVPVSVAAAVPSNDARPRSKSAAPRTSRTTRPPSVPMIPKPSRRTRYIVDSDDDDAAESDDPTTTMSARTDPPAPTTITMHQRRNPKHGAHLIKGALINPVKNYTSVDMGGDMSNMTSFASRTPARARPRFSPISLLTPSPVRSRLDAMHHFDLPTPVKRDITLRFREIGKVVLPAGTTLQTAVREVGRRVTGVLGTDAGEVGGLRDAQGVVEQERWVRQTKGGEEWKVAVEWAW